MGASPVKIGVYAAAAAAVGVICGVGVRELWGRSNSGKHARLMSAVTFAARKHRDQRRKNKTEEPYINHSIRVTNMLATVVGAEEDVLIAAILHDTVEDTDCSIKEISELFGPRVADTVAQVSDDKRLSKVERKRLQIVHAPHLSEQAKLVKLSDKLDNLSDLLDKTPVGWTAERVAEYFNWAEKVIDGLRGTHLEMEKRLDQCLARRSIAIALAK